MAADSSRPPARLDHDPRALEERFVDSLQRCRSRGGGPISSLGPRVAVVAPTRRLLDRLARTATAAAGALAGVHFFVHRGLARHLLTEAGESPLRELPPALAAALLRTRIPRVRSALSDYLAKQASALGPLLATLRDLRDAGVGAAAALKARRLSATARDTLALHRAFEELLQDVGREGFGDAATDPVRARESLDAKRPPFDALLHYGAYDLIGVHRDLVAALAQSVPTELFVPAVAGHELPQRLVTALHGVVVASPAAPPPLRECRLLSAAGPREELRFAVRRLLDWHERDGVPFSDMAILARASEPYVDALAAESALLDVAPDTSFRRPLAQAPAARALALLIASWRAPRDRLARRRVELSLPERWRDAAGARARFEAAASTARRLDVVRELVDTPEPQDRALAGVVARVVVDAQRLEAILEDAAAGEASRDAGVAIDLLLEQLARAPLADADSPTGGLQLLDFHQARGLPLRRAVLIGANERQLPRRAAEDFFLADDDRREIAEATGRPLPLKRDAKDEERLLVDCVRLAVSEQLEISWSRATDERDEAVSPWLARLTTTPAAEARVIPRHPLRELDALQQAAPLLRADEALVAAAQIDSESAVALARQVAAPRADALARGLAMVAAVDDYGARRDAGALRFDGAVGALGAKTRWTPSELERLGRCPLQYFFRHELGVREPEQALPSGELDAAKYGTLCHDLLRDLYRELLPKAQGLAPDCATAIARARARLPELVDAALAAAVAKGELATGLRAARRESIARTLLAFVERDLARIQELGLLGGDYELVDSQVPLATPGAPLPLSLRFDRILRDAQEREWIGDYKTSSRSTLKDAAKLKQVLAGRELQLPIYHLARRARGADVAALEFLALREDDQRDDDPFFPFAIAELEAARGEVLSLLGELATLRAGGCFPLQPEDDVDHGHCGRCEFRFACRHTHGATRERSRAAAEFARYFAIATPDAADESE